MVAGAAIHRHVSIEKTSRAEVQRLQQSRVGHPQARGLGLWVVRCVTCDRLAPQLALIHLTDQTRGVRLPHRGRPRNDSHRDSRHCRHTCGHRWVGDIVQGLLAGRLAAVCSVRRDDADPALWRCAEPEHALPRAAVAGRRANGTNPRSRCEPHVHGIRASAFPQLSRLAGTVAHREWSCVAGHHGIGGEDEPVFHFDCAGGNECSEALWTRWITWRNANQECARRRAVSLQRSSGGEGPPGRCDCRAGGFSLLMAEPAAHCPGSG